MPGHARRTDGDGAGRRDRREERAPKTWGGVARRGTRALDDTRGAPSASDEWRAAVGRARPREEWQPEEWVPEPAKKPEPRPRRGATGPSSAAPLAEPVRRRRKAPEDVARAIEKATGARRAGKAEEQLMEAARAYERERYTDARRMAGRLAEQAPSVPAVRELHGLALYRLGKWREAARELEAYKALSDGVDQNPVLADCYRALRKYDRVWELWEELRTVSPGAALVAEGRIVAAGALADQGRLRDAIALLEKARFPHKGPREHHLRLWYALGDLYERVGEVPHARDLFTRVMRADREFADVAERLAALG